MKPTKPRHAAKGRAARRKPLPRLVQAWRFREGVEAVDAAEALLQLAEQGLQLRLAAQAARAALATTPADDPAHAAMAGRWQQLQRSADTMRAEWLRDVRELLGHASRDLVREHSSRQERHSGAASVTRSQFLQAYEAAIAAGDTPSGGTLFKHWPVTGRAPSERHCRNLLRQFEQDPEAFR